MRRTLSYRSGAGDEQPSIPFASTPELSPRSHAGGPGVPPPAAHDALSAIEMMSRKISDLARELNCLGFFDDDDDRPRAA